MFRARHIRNGESGFYIKSRKLPQWTGVKGRFREEESCRRALRGTSESDREHKESDCSLSIPESGVTSESK